MVDECLAVDGCFADITTISYSANEYFKTHIVELIYLYFIMLPIRYDILDIRDILRGRIDSCGLYRKKKEINQPPSSSLYQDSDFEKPFRVNSSSVSRKDPQSRAKVISMYIQNSGS